MGTPLDRPAPGRPAAGTTGSRDDRLRGLTRLHPLRLHHRGDGLNPQPSNHGLAASAITPEALRHQAIVDLILENVPAWIAVVDPLARSARAPVHQL